MWFQIQGTGWTYEIDVFALSATVRELICLGGYREPAARKPAKQQHAGYMKQYGRGQEQEGQVVLLG